MTTHDLLHHSKKNQHHQQAKHGNKNKLRRSYIAGLCLILGLSLGIAATFFYHKLAQPVDHLEDKNTLSAEEMHAEAKENNPMPQAVNSATVSTQTLAEAKQGTKDTDESKFEFYTILTEQEVMVQDLQRPEITKTKVIKPQTSTRDILAAAENSAQYYTLQVGSFQNLNDANKLYSKIDAAGLKVTIEESLIKRGDFQTTWHRVIVGPFSNADDIQAAEQRLGTLGIKSLLMKRR